MSYFLRRLPLSRLLLLCGLVVALGASATAIAFALGTGPTPPAKPLAEAVHEALAAPPVEGVSARIQLTNHLLEGANLASGSAGTAGELASNPLLTGASGRLWIANDGRIRLELQAEKGDTQLIYDGRTVQLYDAATNTLYRFTPQGDGSSSDGESGGSEHHEVPSVARIEEAIAHLSEHADVSGATPTNIAGQPAYTVRISPKEGGSMLGGAELSWDAVHGAPLRAAIYSSSSSIPVVELAASAISYGPVEASVFEFTPPAGAKIDEVQVGGYGSQPSGSPGGDASHPKLTTFGHGPSTIAVLEHPAGEGSRSSPELPEGLQKVEINGVSAAELPTELGTLLSFERSGVRYLLVGAVTPASIEAVAKGL